MHPRPSTRAAALPRRLAALAACLLAGTCAAAGAGDRGAEGTRTVIDRPGPGTNRIDVTGNSATRVQVHCQDGAAAGAANVNSVNIDGRSLQGRTVVVTGRNTRDVQAGADCARGGTGAAANINSVNIR